MKRFFLIPLLTLFSCVMAFATNVGNLTELQAALATGGEITLTADISGINAALNVNKSVAIDGQGHMLSGAIVNKGILTLVGTNDNMLEVAISNLHIKNTKAKGIAIHIGGYLDSLSIDNSTLECPTKGNNKSIEFDGPQPQNAKIGIRNSTLIASASGYPVRSYNPMNLYIKDCSTSGYCALNFQSNIETSSNPALVPNFAGSRGSKIYAENCYFDAPNVHSSAGSNAFACFAFHDDGINLTLKNCGMNAEVLGNAGQTAFDLGGGYSPVERITDDGEHAINITLEGDNTHINGMFVSSNIYTGVVQTGVTATKAEGYHLTETGYSYKYTNIADPVYDADRAFDGKTTINFVITGGTYSVNPESVSFRGHVLKDQLTEAEKQSDTRNLPDSKFEQLGITIPSTHQVKTITMDGVANPLYRVVPRTTTLYDLNSDVPEEEGGAGQNPNTSFELSTGSEMTLNQATTKAGYVEVSDNGDDATIVKVGKTENPGTPSETKVDQTLVINNGLDVQGDSKVEVQAGSALVIGEGGIVTSKPENIVIEADEDGAASLLLDPTITVNQTPELTVKMTVPAEHAGYEMNGSDKYRHWHRFAMPVDHMAATWVKDPDVPTYLYGWNYSAQEWAQVGVTEMVPFVGYTLSPDKEISTNTAVTYTFKGKLLGNTNCTLNLNHHGYNFFGNSYTGYISILKLVDQIMGDAKIDGTVWMWDGEKYQGIGLEYLRQYGAIEPSWKKEVAPMQTFVLRLTGDDYSSTDINYADAIWGNPRYDAAKTALNAAPARQAEINDDAIISMTIEANGQKESVVLIENGVYSDAYDRGYDAIKYMNENCFNTYVGVNGENYGTVATDILEGKMLNIKTNNEWAYSITFDFVAGEEYALRDNLTGNVIAIEEGATYEFAAQPNSTIECRFEIVSVAKMPTAIENTEVKANVKGIYTLTGQYVGEDFEALPAGVYVVNGVKIVK